MQGSLKPFFNWALILGCLYCLPFLGYGVVERFWILWSQWKVAWARYDAILLGLALYVCLEWIALRKPQGRLCHTLDFLKVFTHELLHMLVSMLFLNRIHAFQAQREEGHVQYYGAGNALIALAPYFLPLYTLLLLFVRTGFSVQTYPIFDVFLGMTYTFHLTTFWQQQSPSQPDLQEVGILPSYLLILTFNLFFLSMMLTVPSRGWAFFWQWLY